MVKSLFDRFSGWMSGDTEPAKPKTPERLVTGITPRQVEIYNAAQEAARYEEEMNRREEDRINQRLAQEDALREAQAGAIQPASKPTSPTSKPQFDKWIEDMEEANKDNRKTG